MKNSTPSLPLTVFPEVVASEQMRGDLKIITKGYFRRSDVFPKGKRADGT